MTDTPNGNQPMGFGEASGQKTADASLEVFAKKTIVIRGYATEARTYKDKPAQVTYIDIDPQTVTYTEGTGKQAVEKTVENAARLYTWSETVAKQLSQISEKHPEVFAEDGAGVTATVTTGSSSRGSYIALA